MKVGIYQIPTNRLFPKIYEAIKLIYENYVLDEAKDADSVAKLCGYKSANNGAWLYKLADMRSYGLLERRTIKATSLAEKFVSGTDEEKQLATNEAIFNISLWKELFKNLGAELPESNFWVQLQKLTGVPNIKAQKYADSVRKAYLGDISHYKPEKKDIEGNKKMEGEQINTTVSMSADILARFTVKDVGYVDVKDKDTYDLAKAYLKVLAKKLGIEEKDKLQP